MNIRKPIDYSEMYAGLDKILNSDMQQMKVFCEIGRLVDSRPEKGAAVAAAEYINNNYSGRQGFSPRSLRRMRDFYRSYKNDPVLMDEAMKVCWSLNAVIIESCESAEERAWYIQAVQTFKWSKTELLNKITENAYGSKSLDSDTKECYTKNNDICGEDSFDYRRTCGGSMANGKIRHSNHLIDQQACRYLQSVLPPEWVQRTMNPDYGLDIDLELFGYEEGVCVTLGEHVYLQIKGTEHANYGTVHPFGELFYTDEEAEKFDWPVLKFNIDVAELLLVERMGAAVPVLLIVVDLKENKAFYVCLNDYIKCVLPYQNPEFRKQDTVTIYVPTDNVLATETSDICLWYGKRAKLFSLFLEILAIVDNAKYLNTAELIQMIESRIDELVHSDAWHASEHWGLLESIHNLMMEMHQNDLLNKAGARILEMEISNGNDPKEILSEYRGERVTAFVAAQAFSCQHFLEQVSATACMFEDDIQHVGLPTKNNWFQTKQ